MSNIIGADAAKLAGLQIDTLQKVRNSQITLVHWERFNNLSPEEREARFGDQWKPTPAAVAEQPKPPTLVLVKTTSFGDIEGKKIGKCFTGKRWDYRDGDIDRWLPAQQPAQAACSAGIYQLQNPQGTILREMAAAALKVGPGTALDLLAKALKEQGLTFMLPAIEQMVERQEDGEDTGLRTDGYANLFFVENSDGSVSVLYVRRRGGRWDASVRRLGGDGGWRAGRRLLLRNSDAVSL